MRARMAKTGESYATARSHVLAAQPGPPVPADQAMLAALHVSNGDCTDLPGTGLVSRVLYWRDALPWLSRFRDLCRCSGGFQVF